MGVRYPRQRMGPTRRLAVACLLACLPLTAVAADVAPEQRLQVPAQKELVIAPKAAPKPAAKPSGPPYNLAVPAFTVTGTGAAVARAPFASKNVTLAEFVVTGTGVSNARAAFAPKSVTLPAFTVTGISR